MAKPPGRRLVAPGPFEAQQLRPGDPYELSNGHAIFTPPAGQRHGRANLLGGKVLETDPSVESAGIDVGFSNGPKELRAPDVAVGNVKDEPGWAKSAPVLAVEYADVGQDEADLEVKIQELFDAGTRLIWVVRLVGERRVDVHAKGERVQTLRAGETLLAPGILANPVPVVALYEPAAAHEATLRNLLNRKGYGSLDDVRREGREEGREEAAETLRRALVEVVASRGFSLTKSQAARIAGETDAKTLARWLTRAPTATSAGHVFRR